MLWLPPTPPAPQAAAPQQAMLHGQVRKPEPVPQAGESLLQPLVIRQAMAAERAGEQAGQENATADATKSEAEQLQDLAARKQALDKREAELHTLESEVDAKLNKLKELEARMQALIESAGAIQDEKMAHLIDVYSNMKPKQAAQVLETLEEPIAVRILAGMSGRKAGEILSSVRADRAAALSAALTRLQTGETGK